jgi:hypothetical protein
MRREEEEASLVPTKASRRATEYGFVSATANLERRFR